MERQAYRSTSQIDILAELHERDLLEEARRPNLPRRIDRPLTILGRLMARRRARR